MPCGATALVERDSELATLVAALAADPATVVVEGEPGIGKTRLVRQALAAPALAGRQVLTGSARPGSDAYLLAPVLEALAGADLRRAGPLSPLTGTLAGLLPERAHLLPTPPPPVADRLLARHRVLRAAAELLRCLGDVVLVLEDLHWVDSGTVDLLGMLGTEPSDGLSLLLTYRPTDLPRDATLPVILTAARGDRPPTRIRLRPLSADGTGRLAARILGGDPSTVSSDLAGLLQDRCGGVPSVVEEDVRLLRARQLVRRQDGAWHLAASDPDALRGPLGAAVPASVEADVRHRLERVGEVAREVLGASAVTGEPADVALLATVTGHHPDRVVAGIAEAVRVGLLAERGGTGPGFRHTLARQAVYRATPATRRRRMHAAAAEALTARGVPELADRVAEQHRLAGNLTESCRAAERAADLAEERGDLRTAYRHLREVLRSGAAPEDRRAGLAVRLGWAAHGCGAPAVTTAALLSEALRGAIDSAEQRGTLRLLRVWAWLEGGAGNDATTTELTTALGELADHPGPRALALATLALPHAVPAARLSEQLAHLRQARSLLGQVTDPVVHGFVRDSGIAVTSAAGDPQAWDLVDALGPGCDDPAGVRTRTVRGLICAAEAALFLGHHRRARRLCERGLRLAAEFRLATDVHHLHAVLLRTVRALGETSAADHRDARPADDQRMRSRLHRQLLIGQRLVERGESGAAVEPLRATVEEALRTGELSIAGYAAAELNRAAQGPGQRHMADLSAGRVLDAVVRKQAWAWTAPLLPFAHLDLVRRATGSIRDRPADAPLLDAALRFAEARLAEADGDPVRAAAGYATAGRMYAALPDPRMAAHATTAEVRCRLDSGLRLDPDLLSGAWRTFQRLDAGWDANRVRQLFRRAGLPGPHRRGRPGYGNRLSPREREIADLAVRGHTNRDIAGKLFLSERTVKYHLGNAMRKLGVGNRRQLPGALESRPPTEPRHLGTGGSTHTCVCGRCGRVLNGN